MAATFEIAKAEDESFYFRLRAADGTLVAVSPRFKTLKGVVTGITAVRESAATGLVVDRSGPVRTPAALASR
ncbi:YegP family protein [Arthrobacter sp. 92]|uniref:YegP family protein n=1 Tax=Arthrobacter sp. 92 TaxID=3418175 RepID=UPI003D028C66